jgi:hypothetical protein
MPIEPPEIPPATPGQPTEPPREDPPGLPQPEAPPPMREPGESSIPEELPGHTPDEFPTRGPNGPNTPNPRPLWKLGTLERPACDNLKHACAKLKAPLRKYA